MKRRTPVRELQAEDNSEASLRRSSRIAQNSPVPTKITQRRNSSNSDTTPKATKGRRLSLSQENNSDSTESKASSETSVTSTPKKTRLTRSASKSPTSWAKDFESKAVPSRARNRRGSLTKSIDEENTHTPSQKSSGRSTRSESKSPITVKDVEPAKPRTRRGSVTEKIVPMEKIEEIHPSTPEPRKRTKSRRSSLTEMSQLDVIEETKVNKAEVKKSELASISEAKENDEKEKSTVSDSPESKEKTKAAVENCDSKEDKFKMSPVVVIQKSKTIADLTTAKNSEKENIVKVEETKIDLANINKIEEKTENNIKIEENKLTPITVSEHNKMEHNTSNENYKIEKEDIKSVTEENSKLGEGDKPNKELESDSKQNIKSQALSDAKQGKGEKNQVPDNQIKETFVGSTSVGAKQGKEEKNQVPDNQIKETFVGSTSVDAKQGKEEKNQVPDNQIKETFVGSASVDAKQGKEEKNQVLDNQVKDTFVGSASVDAKQDKEEKNQVPDNQIKETFIGSASVDAKQDKEEKNEVPHNQIKETFVGSASDTKEEVLSLDILSNGKKQADEPDKPNLDKEGQCSVKKLTPEDESILKDIDSVLNTNTDTSQNEKTDISKTKGSDLEKTETLTDDSETTEKTKDLNIGLKTEKTTPTSKKQKETNQLTQVRDSVQKTSLQAADKEPLNTLTDKSKTSKEIKDLNIDINAEEMGPISKSQNESNHQLTSVHDDVEETSLQTADKEPLSTENDDKDNSLNSKIETSQDDLSKDKSFDIDVKKVEIDMVKCESQNKKGQSTPVNDMNVSLHVSDKELAPSRDLDIEDTSNSKISSPEDLCNKSLSNLLPNQAEMISGSDGSFQINLSLQNVQGFSSLEDLSECKQSKEKSLIESDVLNKDGSFSEENKIKKQNEDNIPKSIPTNEKNTSSVNLSLKEIEKNPKIIEKRVQDSFYEPMDVDDPSLLHIDDIISTSKRRSLNIEEELSSPSKKIRKPENSPMIKSGPILDDQENIRILENDHDTSDIELKTNETAASSENEKNTKECDISKEDMNTSEALNLNLNDEESNKIECNKLKETEEHSKKGKVVETELSTAKSINKENITNEAAASTENERITKKYDIPQEDMNTSEAINLNLNEEESNKIECNKLKETEEHSEKAKVVETELSTVKSINKKNITIDTQSQQGKAMDLTENIQNLSDVSDIANESASIDTKEIEKECLSPAFSINSADLTDENDDGNIVENNLKELNTVKQCTEPSVNLENISPINKSIIDAENETNVQTKVVIVEKRAVEGAISDVKIYSLTEENIEVSVDIEKHSDKKSNEKQTKTISEVSVQEISPMEKSEAISSNHTKIESKKSEATMKDKADLSAQPINETNSSEVISVEKPAKINDPIFIEGHAINEPSNLEKSTDAKDELSFEIEVDRKSISEKDVDDKSTEQVSSTTSSKTKSRKSKKDKISKTVQNPETSFDKSKIDDSLNEDVDKNSLSNGDGKSQIESNKDFSLKKDTESNIARLITETSDEEQQKDATNISFADKEPKPTKSKSKKETKMNTNETLPAEHSIDQKNRKDVKVSLKDNNKQPLKSKSYSDSESLLDENVATFIEETMKELVSSSEDENNEEETNNEFIDDMAEEGEEDTPSEGSNDIVCDGESINSSDTYTEDDDDSYEADSFIDDNEDKRELLSGEETFLQDEVNKLKSVETKRKSISPQKDKKKRKRIVTVSDSEDEVTIEQEPTNKETIDIVESNKKVQEEDVQIVNKFNTTDENKELKTKDSSDDNVYQENIDEDIPTDLLPSKNDVIHVYSDSDNESVEQDTINNDKSDAITENRSNRKSSITIQENIKLEDIEDGELSERISKVVDWFYTGIRNNSDTGNISLNVSLDYADLPTNEEIAAKNTDANVKFEDSNIDVSKESKKRKSEEYLTSESLKKVAHGKVIDEIFKETKLTKPKLSKKSKSETSQKENQISGSSNEISSEENVIPGKTRKKRAHKLAVLENLNDQQKLGTKISSKRLSDEKINYLSPKRIKRSTDKQGNANKAAAAGDGISIVVKDIALTLNKKKRNKTDEYDEVFIETDEVAEIYVKSDKLKKPKKTKKAERVFDDVEYVKSMTNKDDLPASKTKRTKRAKKTSLSDEDNTIGDNDFQSISNKKINKPATRKVTELNNEFNIEIENKKSKKQQRLSYPTKKTEIPCSSGVLKQQFISNTIASKCEVAQKQEKKRKLRQKGSRKILPSKTTNLDDSWESEIFDMNLHPSKSNRKQIDAGTSKKKKTDVDSFSSKDFKNKMLYDSSRIKRMATKVLLKQRKGI